MNQHGLLQSYASIWELGIRVLDLVVILCAGIGAYYVWFGTGRLSEIYEITILVGVLLGAVIFPRFGLYQSWRGLSVGAEIRTIIAAWLLTLAVLSIVDLFIRASAVIDVGWLGLWLLSSCASQVLLRLTVRSVLNWMRSHGLNSRRIVVVVGSERGFAVIDRLSIIPWTGFKVLGYFDDGITTPHDKPHSRTAMLGGVADLAQYVEHERVDQVWLAYPLRAEQRLKQVMYELRHATADVRCVLDTHDFYLLNHSVSEIGGMPVLNLCSTPMVGFNRLLKALEDRLLALIILILVSPLLLVIAIAIKLESPGPVLFRQTRHGWDGRRITVWKFRSMKVHNEARGKVTQAVKNDPRITAVGAFLRRTSLDELPQFINVLQGTMSIVGPRPHAIEHNDYYKNVVKNYMLRHKVKPGITGWAQINGLRGETNTLDKMERRVQYDLQYIENWSLWLDLRIITMTIFKGFTNPNAY